MRRKANKSSPPRKQLPPVIIPNLFPPRPGDTQSDGGLGVRHVEHPLEVFLLKPANAPPGTFIRLFWHNTTQPVAQMVVTEAHQTEKLFVFRVPTHYIRPPWADTVQCLVQPSDGNDPLLTEPLKVRINLDRPGGRDPDSTKPGNQAFSYSLPPDIALTRILDDQRARQGVVIEVQPYPYMAEFDLLRIAWGSKIVTYQVTAADVGNSVFITVDYTTILSAGDDDHLPIAVQPEDGVGNKPDLYEPWSEVQHLQVVLTTDLLDAPFLPFGATIIDLDELAGKDQKIHIYLDIDFFAAGDVLLLIFDGRDADGFNVPHTQLIVLQRVGYVLELFVPSAIVSALAEGTAIISYTLTINTKVKGRKRKAKTRLVLPSKKFSVSVKGEYIPWKAPDVLEDQSDGSLDPDSPRATVVFQAQPGWDANPEYWLSVIWSASNSDGTVRFVLERQVGAIPPDGKMEFTLAQADIRSFKGLMVRIVYELRDKETDPDYRRESLPLFLRVGDLVTGLLETVIDQAFGDWLNPIEVPATGATGHIPFTETLANDTLRLFWQGETEELSTRESFLIDATTAGKVVPFTIDKSWVLLNEDKQVSVTYVLERPGQIPRTSKTLGLTIEAREVILSENFDNLNNRLIGPGEFFDIDSMTILNVLGPSQCGIYNYHVQDRFPEQLEGPAIAMSYMTHDGTSKQHTRLTFKFRYTYIKFAVTWLHFKAEVHFYNKEKELHVLEYPGQLAPPGQGVWIEFSAPAGEIITHIETVTTDYCFMDFFTFGQ